MNVNVKVKVVKISQSFRHEIFPNQPEINPDNYIGKIGTTVAIFHLGVKCEGCNPEPKLGFVNTVTFEDNKVGYFFYDELEILK